MSDPQRPWLRVVQGRGLDAVGRLFDEMVAGRVTPEEGHVLSLLS